tara:strand:- start:2457 stop:2594 length:138 start_codon:yes stop_codon:yes gene_type:complete
MAGADAYGNSCAPSLRGSPLQLDIANVAATSGPMAAGLTAPPGRD